MFPGDNYSFDLMWKNILVKWVWKKVGLKKTKMASGQFAENQLLVASSLNTSSMIDLFAIYAKFTNDNLAAF